MLIVATSVGAGSLAEDVGNRSITLYLSRPIRLIDYLAAKSAATGRWLVIAAVVPGWPGLAVVLVLGWAPTSLVLSGAGAFWHGPPGISVLHRLGPRAFVAHDAGLYAGVASSESSFLSRSPPPSSRDHGQHVRRHASPITDLLSVAQSAFGIRGPMRPTLHFGGLARI